MRGGRSARGYITGDEMRHRMRRGGGGSEMNSRPASIRTLLTNSAGRKLSHT